MILGHSVATNDLHMKVDASAVTAAYNLQITGGSGADTITAGAGNDTVIAGDAGVDVLDGGAGTADVLNLSNALCTTGLALNISGNIENYPEKPIGSNLEPTKRNPSIYLKAAFDKQVNDDLRVRLSASTYQNSSIVRNTLYAGDRTGSHYFMVMEPNTTGVTAMTNFTSGRFNPGLTNRVSAVMINPFVKFKGLELFGAYEIAKGGTYTEANDRKWTQFVAEGVFRFLPNEQAYIGARYNTTTGRPSGTAYTADVTIERTSLVAGWFPTRNLLLKGELVNQKYIDFPTSVIYNEGKFNGLLIEAVIGF